MKKLLFILAIALASCQQQTDNKCHLTLSLPGAPDSTRIYISNVDGSDYEEVVLHADGGKYTYTADVPETRDAIIVPYGEQDQYHIFLVPNETVEVTVKEGGEYHMSGGKVYEQLDEALSVMRPHQTQIAALAAEAQARIAAGENQDALSAELQNRWTVLIEDLMDACCEYIKSHPQSHGSIVMLSNLPAEKYDEHDAMIDDAVKSGPMANIYAHAKARHEKEAMEAEAEANVSEGKPAPDFTLATIEGGELKLSDLRGKYVVIDFWGSWCGWCIKGMPEMKKYYKKYAGKLEILGVACGDTDEAWREAVKKHDLPWRHVLNGEGEADATALYAVQGFPTKYIIDPDGKIAKVVVGETPEFYAALDSLLK